MSEIANKLKDAIAAKLLMLINNPHTSGSAFIYGTLKVAGIIWPEAKVKLDEIASALVVYGLTMAGDARPRNGNGGADNPPQTNH